MNQPTFLEIQCTILHSSLVTGHYEHPHSNAIKLNSSDCAAIGVAVSISYCQRIHLNLDHCKIGPTGFVALLNGIAECDKLETLRWVASLIFKELSVWSNLILLRDSFNTWWIRSLADNNISNKSDRNNEGMSTFGEWLKYYTNLKKLKWVSDRSVNELCVWNYGEYNLQCCMISYN